MGPNRWIDFRIGQEVDASEDLASSCRLAWNRIETRQLSRQRNFTWGTYARGAIIRNRLAHQFSLIQDVPATFELINSSHGTQAAAACVPQFFPLPRSWQIVLQPVRMKNFGSRATLRHFLLVENEYFSSFSLFSLFLLLRIPRFSPLPSFLLSRLHAIVS